MDTKLKIERNATIILREALEDCKACQIKKPECKDTPPICFPDVECRDTFDGPVCGPCPQGWCGDGKVNNIIKLHKYISHYDIMAVVMQYMLINLFIYVPIALREMFLRRQSLLSRCIMFGERHCSVL